MRGYSNIILLVLGLLTGLNGCALNTRQLRPVFHPELPNEDRSRQLDQNIRVAIKKSAASAVISSTRPITIYNLADQQKLGMLEAGFHATWTFTSGTFSVNDRVYSADAVQLAGQHGAGLQVDGRHYRGQIILARDDDQRMRVINILPLEEYLQGVVPNEVLAKWPMEVLKAQAVAARTFAVYKMSGTRQKDFDLDASVNSQVYRGWDSEKDASNQAVAATRGIIASYQGRVIAAFYHSNCGGHTADSRMVWGSDIDYLHGTRCAYCEQGPHYQWTYQITKSNLQRILNQHNYDIDRIRSIRLEGRDNSNRIKDIGIQHAKGHRTIRSSAFRMAVGADKIRSTNFYIAIKGETIHFHGKGWGHGVGLCQEGARQLAEKGLSYQSILKFYYPGIDISRLK